MSRTGRKHSGTGIYHVMLRGVNRQGVFEEPEDYREGWNQTCPYDSVPMIPLSIHEITHVRQSLVAGGLKFKNGNLLNTGTTSRGKAKIEIEAYKMQYSYDKSFPGYINSINDINIQSVGNIKKENGEFVYQEINTLYMNELKQKRNNKKLGF